MNKNKSLFNFKLFKYSVEETTKRLFQQTYNTITKNNTDSQRRLYR